MERKLQERMVGAGVLIIALVIVGPMILDGRSDDVTEDAIPGQRSEELRTHTFQMNEAASSPARPTEIPQPPALPAPGRQPVISPGTNLPPPATQVTAAAPPPKPAVVEVPAAPVPKVAEPATKAPVPPPGARTVAGDWLVQVGTFGQKDNADRLTASLKQRGFAAFVSSAARSGKTLYRVRVGPAGTREEAGKVATRLAAAGQAGQIVAAQ
jgi:DedD protein